MPLYLMLGNMGTQTRARVAHNPRHINEEADALSGPEDRFLTAYALMGRFDYVLVAEATDDNSAANMSLALSNATGLRLETSPILRADGLSAAIAAAADQPPAGTTGAEATVPTRETVGEKDG